MLRCRIDGKMAIMRNRKQPQRPVGEHARLLTSAASELVFVEPFMQAIKVGDFGRFCQLYRLLEDPSRLLTEEALIPESGTVLLYAINLQRFDIAEFLIQHGPVELLTKGYSENLAQANLVSPLDLIVTCALMPKNVKARDKERD